MTLAPFISLDGIDGTGKSTQCRLLVEWLNANGIPAIGCSDPGGTPVGDELRSLLLSSRAEITHRGEALLFMASRAELVEKVIRPNLEQGRIVVSDRFIAANVAYQGYGHGLSPAELWQVGRFSSDGLLPDLTIILDLPVPLAVARRGRNADRMESLGLDYLERVRQGFIAEAARDPERFRVVDASRPCNPSFAASYPLASPESASALRWADDLVPHPRARRDCSLVRFRLAEEPPRTRISFCRSAGRRQAHAGPRVGPCASVRVAIQRTIGMRSVQRLRAC
jgi:dTMP kinase